MLEASKTKPDQWGQNPCRVTSFLAITLRSNLYHKKPLTYGSPPCGFGWGFHFDVKLSSKDSKVDPTKRNIIVDVSYKPKSCSGFQLKDISFHVVVKLQGSISTPAVPFVLADQSYEDKGLSIAKDCNLGAYTRPLSRPDTMIQFELTLIFNSEDKLSFPSGPSIELNRALTASLDGKHMMDTKFYLYSSKSKGEPARPRVLYGNASVLKCLSSYFEDLLSDDETGFQAGTRCQFHEDLPEVVGRLEKSAYGFDADSDSDLEDEEATISVFQSASLEKGKKAMPSSPPSSSCTPVVESPKPCASVSLDSSSTKTTEVNSFEVKKAPDILDIASRSSHEHIVSAFVINGTAHKTWKALLHYAYTDQIHFKNIKSTDIRSNNGTNSTGVTCSPKSMYRLADYVDIPVLKKLAKQKILSCISGRNVVEELFSSFTSRYDEIIEMESDYLAAHFTDFGVSSRFTNILHEVVSGAKPYGHNALSITIQKLYNHSPIPSPIPPPIHSPIHSPISYSISPPIPPPIHSPISYSISPPIPRPIHSPVPYSIGPRIPSPSQPILEWA